MQIDQVETKDLATAYDSRPWIKHYPPDVAHSLTYPEQTVWGLLEEIAKQYGDKTAYIFQNYGMSFRQLQRSAARMSAATGVSVEEFSALNYATKLTGGTTSQLSKALVTLSKAVAICAFFSSNSSFGAETFVR